MKQSQNSREAILKAAENRFFQYGFNKTTMAEIAADCAMSPANIYRYFDSKQDIVAELANQCLLYVEDSLHTVLKRPGLSADDRLRLFAMTQLASNYELYADSDKIQEAISFIATKRQDLTDRHCAVIKEIIGKILQEGVHSGVFQLTDPGETAEYIHNALMLIAHPLFMRKYGREDLERNARGIIELLLAGLKKG